MKTRRTPRLRRFFEIASTLLALTVAILLLGRHALFQGPYLPPSPLPAGHILDMHCHLAGIGAGDSGCFISPDLRSNFRFRIYLEAFGVSESDLLAHGDLLVARRISEHLAASRHVSRAIVLALDGVVDPSGHFDSNRTQVYIPNDFVAEACRRHTNLLFGASIHPFRADALERLDLAAAQGAVLVKWIPSIMDIDPADPRLTPFYQRLRDHRLPLLSHTGPERSFTSSNDDLAAPDRLRLPLQLGVTVIAAHVAAGRTIDGVSDLQRLRQLMTEFPHLYADISALTQINRLGVLREVLDSPEFQGRLLYGSDFPLINTALVSPWYFPLQLTELRRQQIAALENPWDRDVELKQALGLPAEIFSLPESLLLLHSATRPSPDTHLRHEMPPKPIAPGEE